jgi:hypothetical protein
MAEMEIKEMTEMETKEMGSEEKSAYLRVAILKKVEQKIPEAM